VSGSNAIDAAGVYGVKGTSSASNYPGARQNHAMVIRPSTNSLFMYGGYGQTTSTGAG